MSMQKRFDKRLLAFDNIDKTYFDTTEEEIVDHVHRHSSKCGKEADKKSKQKEPFVSFDKKSLLFNTRRSDKVHAMNYKMLLAQNPQKYVEDNPILRQHKITSMRMQSNTFYDNWPKKERDWKWHKKDRRYHDQKMINILKTKNEMNTADEEARDSYKEALMITQNSVIWQAERVLDRNK